MTIGMLRRLPTSEIDTASARDRDMSIDQLKDIPVPVVNGVIPVPVVDAVGPGRGRQYSQQSSHQPHPGEVWPYQQPLAYPEAIDGVINTGSIDSLIETGPIDNRLNSSHRSLADTNLRTEFLT